MEIDSMYAEEEEREKRNAAERAKYDRIGGKEWLRAALKRARET